MNTASKTHKKQKLLHRVIRLILIILIIACCGYYAYTSLKAQYTITYNSYTASIGSVANSLSFSGNLELIDSEMFSSSAATSVKKVYISTGDEVKAGTKLIRLGNGTMIESSIDGRVNVLNVSAGDSVSAGDALVQVADFKHMKVTFRIDEYDITKVSIGDVCTVTTTATEKSFESRIDTIDYISTGGNVAYYTAVTYVDVDDDVYPGMQVTVTITQEQAVNAVILKADALSFDRTNKAYVMMYDENKDLKKIDVEIGVSNGNYVEIKSGLSDGDEVFVEAKEEEKASGVSGLLAGLFGSNRVNQMPGMNGGYRGGNYGNGNSSRNSGNSSGTGGFPGPGFNGGMPGGGN